MPKAKYLDPGDPSAGAQSMKKWIASHGVNPTHLIMTSPAFHRIKASIPSALRAKRTGGSRRLLGEEELHAGTYDGLKLAGDYYGYWEDNSRWDHHVEGFTRREDAGDYYLEREYTRTADRSAYLSPWTVVTGVRTYRVEKQRANPAASPANLPRLPSMQFANQTPASFPTPGIRNQPGPQLHLPDVPGATYPPKDPPSVRRGNASVNREPSFRRGSYYRRSAYRRRLKWSDLYRREQDCILHKVGKLRWLQMDYPQQISSLRACMRAATN